MDQVWRFHANDVQQNAEILVHGEAQALNRKATPRRRLVHGEVRKPMRWHVELSRAVPAKTSIISGATVFGRPMRHHRPV